MTVKYALKVGLVLVKKILFFKEKYPAKLILSFSDAEGLL